MVEQSFFYITKMTDHLGGTYYKITDRKSKRYCYATPKMLDEVLLMLVNCIREGKYVIKNYHTLDYKVWCMFLDVKACEEQCKKYRGTATRIKRSVKTSIEWALINYYLEKRKFNLDMQV